MLLCLFQNVNAQRDSTKFNATQKALIYSESAVIVGTMAGLATIWYNEPKQKFKFFNDSKEWLQMDKAGHVMTSHAIISSNHRLLNYANIPDRFAIPYLLVSTASYMTFIEVLDGFSTGYGASISDLAANATGIGIYYLQYKTNTRDCFTLKYSYRNSGLATYRPKLLGSNGAERWLKDYNGQSYWLSLNPAAIFRSEKFPNWLNVAFGYGADGLLGGNNNPIQNEAGQVLPQLERRRSYALSLDIETRQLFKKHKTLNRIVSVISFIKIPLPGVVFVQGAKPEFQLLGF